MLFNAIVATNNAIRQRGCLAPAIFGAAMQRTFPLLYAIMLLLVSGQLAFAQTTETTSVLRADGEGIAQHFQSEIGTAPHAFVAEPISRHQFTAFEIVEVFNGEDDDPSRDDEHGGATAFAFASYYAGIIDFIHHCAASLPQRADQPVSRCIMHAVFLI